MKVSSKYADAANEHKEDIKKFIMTVEGEDASLEEIAWSVLQQVYKWQCFGHDDDFMLNPLPSVEIIDLGEVVSNFDRWIADYHGITPILKSSECNNPAVLTLLSRLGSVLALKTTKAIKDDSSVPENTFLDLPFMSRKELMSAKKVPGLSTVSCSLSLAHLCKVINTWPQARIILDIPMSFDSETAEWSIPKDDILQIAFTAKDHKICIHGLRLNTETDFKEKNSVDSLSLVKLTVECLVMMKQVNHDIQLLDVTQLLAVCEQPKEMCAVLTSRLRCWTEGGLQILCDSGSVLTRSAVSRCVQVMGSRQQDDNTVLYVNDSVWENFGHLLVEEDEKRRESPAVISADHNQQSSVVTVLGYTGCERSDVLSPSCPLTSTVSCGDWLVFTACGHSAPPRHQVTFNGRLPCHTALVCCPAVLPRVAAALPCHDTQPHNHFCELPFSGAVLDC